MKAIWSLVFILINGMTWICTSMMPIQNGEQFAMMQQVMEGAAIEGEFLVESSNQECCNKLENSEIGNEDMRRLKNCYLTFSSTDLEHAQNQVSTICGVNSTFTVTPNNKVIYAGFTTTWGLDRSDRASNSIDYSFSPEYDGTDVTAYVIDTGIDPNHPEFEGRASLGPNFANDGSDATDLNGHGTHCAGTIGAKSYGIAKNVNIIGIRALNKNGLGSSSTVLASIEWAVKHMKENKLMGLLSLSLSGARNDALDRMIAEAADEGMIIIMAAGNQNKDACNYSPGRTRHSEVITVGAMDQTDTRASFSNYGSCVDMFAPGVDIESTWICNDGSCDGSNDSVLSLSGTSMATPHVAGAVALFLQKHRGNVTRAVEDLYETAHKNVIEEAGEGSSTSALQVDRNAANTISYGVCVSITCLNHEPSEFGPSFDIRNVNLDAAVEISDTDLCQSTSQDFTGKVVLVPKVGPCYFTDKVRHAQEKGAIFVIFYNTEENSAISVPSVPFSESDTGIIINSLMVSYESAGVIRALPHITIGRTQSDDIWMPRSDLPFLPQQTSFQPSDGFRIRNTMTSSLLVLFASFLIIS